MIIGVSAYYWKNCREHEPLENLGGKNNVQPSEPSDEKSEHHHR